jgi:hypothetical protein
MICRWCKKHVAEGTAAQVGLVRPYDSDDPTAAFCPPEPACSCKRRQHWRHIMEGAAQAMEKLGTEEDWTMLGSVLIGETYKSMEIGIKDLLAKAKKVLTQNRADVRRRDRRQKRRAKRQKAKGR